MVGHDTPSINDETFFSSAEIVAVGQRFSVDVPCKYINPIDHCKRYEIDGGRVVELVIPAH